jgi:AcrR family transcriptional regulator
MEKDSARRMSTPLIAKEKKMSSEIQRKGPPAKSGKLKPEARRAALLRAAKELSVEEGVAAPSLEAIIQRAGGSRRSIYTEFGGKAGLLDALIEEVSAEILVDRGGLEGDLRASLTHFARNLISVLMSARGVALARIVLLDAFSSRERAAAFFARGPGKGVKRLTKILEEARARGEIDVTDCERAANCFIGIARGNLFMERALQLRAPPDTTEIEAHIQTAVDIFLDGVKRKTE